MPKVVGLAASAGGLSALGTVLSGFDAALPAPVIVVEHLLPGHESALASILAKRTPLLVKQAEDGDALVPGTVFIAPPDFHTVVDREGLIRLEPTPPVRFVRPSVDRLFETLATVFGERAVVAILTGTGHDGSAGARAVKRAGGTVFVQDEASSEHFGMPRSVIESVEVDRVLPLEEISGAIIGMISEEARP